MEQVKDWLNKVHIGHVLDVLRQMPSGFVDCVVTSPPYWGLRDYETEPQIWDGKEDCEHEWGDFQIKKTSNNFNINFNERWGNSSGQKKQENLNQRKISQGQFCLYCEAWRGQLGLEPTYNLYIKHLLQIFNEIKRVLKPTGVFWLNIDDCYSGSGKGGDKRNNLKKGLIKQQPTNWKLSNLKSKNLIGIPWRVALALQDEGWWLRSDIIWHKPNCMPEPVKDRPTRSFEHVFLLTKSEKYYFDTEAVKEKAVKNRSGRKNPGSLANMMPKWRNIRDVWVMNTQPYSEAHFATFTEELPKRCIMASTSEKGCCPQCGKPWVRILKRVVYKQGGSSGLKTEIQYNSESSNLRGEVEFEHIGWKPSCKCDIKETIPAVVLDPFIGSGTTAEVAYRLMRDWVGIDLSLKYKSFIEKRVKTVREGLFFNQ